MIPGCREVWSRLPGHMNGTIVYYCPFLTVYSALTVIEHNFWGTLRVLTQLKCPFFAAVGEKTESSILE